MRLGWIVMAMGVAQLAFGMGGWEPVPRSPACCKPCGYKPPGWGEVGADCNLNGMDDAIDIANGASVDANNNGCPDECEDP